MKDLTEFACVVYTLTIEIYIYTFLNLSNDRNSITP